MADSELSVERKDQKVKIKTIDGKSTVGCINIAGFERISDFLKSHQDDYLMVYNAGPDQDKTMFFVKRNMLAVEDCS